MNKNSTEIDIAAYPKGVVEKVVKKVCAKLRYIN